ncbi:hypothetical protein [Candidatus Ferrigenium straubiae]|jgi:hypothetical protein|uniref:hypothetical protein n=1 Tax=Candidatus Ferrigenium straubiae TaxID=2919506 RepID=UPI003F4AAAA8
MTTDNKDPLGIGHWPRWKQIAVFFLAMSTLFAVFSWIAQAYGSLKANDRPEPPTFVATGNKPSADVAIDFMVKYSATAQAAIERTPYGISDSAKQIIKAQKQYKDDGDYLIRWADAGNNLFSAADIQVCKVFVAAVFSAWKTAYPLNGPVSDAEMNLKKQISAYSNETAEQCKNHLRMPGYGK